MSKKEDKEFGSSNEQKALPTISSFLKTDLKKDPNPYSVFDFSNEAKTIMVELKSRRIFHDQYSTAILGANKIDSCIYPNVEYYFVWLYKDGIFYLKYDKKLFDTFVKQDNYKINFRYDVGRSEISKVVHIPYKHLTKIPNLTII